MPPVNKEQLVQSAEKNVARGKLDIAIKEYERVLEESPRDASTLNRIGDLWLRLNKVEEAKRVFARTAFVYIEDGFLVKAIAMYKKIIKCDPTGIDAYERLADLYHRQGLVNEARTQYQVLADYHQKHGNSTAAAAMLERLVELEPDSPGHRARLAELYQQMGAVDRSLAERRSIADLLLERSHEDEAVKVLMTAFALRPDDLEFVADTVQSLRARGFVGPAARFLAQVCERNPAAQELVIRRLGGAVLAPSGPAPAPPPSAPEPRSLPQPAVESAPPAVAEATVRFADGAPALETDAWTFPAPPVASTAAPLPEMRPEPAAPKPRLRVEGDPSPPLPKPKRSPEWGGEMPPPDVTFSFEPLTVEELAPHDPLAGSGAPGGAVGRAANTDFEDLGIEIEIEGHAEADGTDWRDLAEPVEEVAAPAVEVPAPVQTTRAVTPRELGEASVAADEIAAAHSRVQRVEEQIAEAEVLAKYGLVGRALERLRELVRREPGQADAYRAMIEIHFEQGRRDRVAEVATQWLAQVGGSPHGPAWREIRERLESEGFSIQGRTVLPPGGPRPGEPARPSVDSLLRDLVRGKPEPQASRPSRPAPIPPPVSAPQTPAPPVAPPVPRAAPPVAAAPTPRPPQPAPASPKATPPPAEPVAPPKKKRLSLADLDLDDLNATLSIPQKKAVPAAAKPKPAPAPVAAPAPPPPAAAQPAAFSVREDSFAELDFDDPPPTAVRPPVSPPQEVVGQRPSAFASVPVPEPRLEVAPAVTPAPSHAIDPPVPISPAIGIRKTSEPLHTADWLDLGDLASPWTEIPEVAARTDSVSSTFAGELLAPLPPLDAPLPPPSPPTLRSTAQDLFEDTAVSWLDAGDAKQESAERALFDDEGEFFDLAAELERELATENAKRAANVEPEVMEQSLEEIVESFKKGVAENLPAEDYDTHFNLGIAYREMGLVDEAIGEFQLAAKAPEHFLDCCSLLGLCFLEKGLPELAVKWYRRALEVPGLAEDQQLALQYELANALTVAGERDAAYKTFVDIYGSNSHFRDVVMRIAELKPR